MRICSLLRAASELASSEMRREKKQQYIGSTSHQSSRKAWPRICNSFKRFIFVFSTHCSYYNLNLSLSFNLSDFTFFFRNSIVYARILIGLGCCRNCTLNIMYCPTEDASTVRATPQACGGRFAAEIVPPTSVVVSPFLDSLARVTCTTCVRSGVTDFGLVECTSYTNDAIMWWVYTVLC